MGVKGTPNDKVGSHYVFMVSAGTMSAFTLTGTAGMNSMFLFGGEHSYLINSQQRYDPNMSKLHAEFVNTFLNSFGFLDFHSVSVYSHTPATDFQKNTKE